MRSALLLGLALALAQPPPPGFYAPSAGQHLPCTCPAACPAVRADYSVDATLSGAHSLWAVDTLAGSGTWSGSDVNGQGTVATFNNPSTLCGDYNATQQQLPPLIFAFDYIVHSLRAVTPGGTVSTLAGPSTIGNFGYVDSAVPSAARFNQPRQCVRTPSGVLYMAGGSNHAIRQVFPNGTTGTLSGNGTAGFRNGPLLSATFNGPCGLAMDAAGALYVSDTLNHAMRLVSRATGLVSTLAGNGTAGSANGIGTSATFNTPYTVAVTPSGSVLYVADRLSNRIRSVSTATRAVATIAGNGTGSTVIARSCVGEACTFANPVGIALLPSGMLVVVELFGHRVRLLNPATGLAVLLAGSPAPPAGFVDNVLGLDARFSSPTAAVLMPDGVTLAIADSANKRIRTLTCSACPAGQWCSLSTPPAPCAAGRWGGAAGNYSSALCAGPCTAPPGRYCPTGTAAPTGIPCPVGYYCTGGVAQAVACVSNPGCAAGSSSDGAPAPSPSPPAPCPAGFYCPGFPAYSSVLRCACAAACQRNASADPTALLFSMATLAGSGTLATVDGFGTSASFSNPSLVTALSGRGLMVNDYTSHVVRSVTPDGLVRTVAGSGTSAYVNGVGTAAAFAQLRAGVQAPNGTIYLADQNAFRVRTLSPAGVVGVLAGNGSAFSIDGPFAASSFLGLCGMALDDAGALYVTEGCNSPSHTVRVLAGGVVRTLAGSSAAGFANGVGSVARFSTPYGAAVQGNGSVLYVADRANMRVRALAVASRAVSTLAGNGSSGGSNGIGTSGVMFNNPAGLALAPGEAVLYVTELGGHRVRSIRLPSAIVDTVIGTPAGAPGNALGVGALAAVNQPMGITVDWSGNLVFTDVNNFAVRRAACSGCAPGHWCAQGTQTPCAAGRFDSGASTSTTPACSGPCAAPPGNFCPLASPNASGVPCAPSLYCTGGGHSPCPAPCLRCALGGQRVTPAPLQRPPGQGGPAALLASLKVQPGLLAPVAVAAPAGAAAGQGGAPPLLQGQGPVAPPPHPPSAPPPAHPSLPAALDQGTSAPAAAAGGLGQPATAARRAWSAPPPLPVGGRLPQPAALQAAALWQVAALWQAAAYWQAAALWQVAALWQAAALWQVAAAPLLVRQQQVAAAAPLPAAAQCPLPLPLPPQVILLRCSCRPAQQSQPRPAHLPHLRCWTV